MIYLISGLIGVTVATVLAWYSLFCSAYVLSLLWAWFAVPRGLPGVSWHEFAAMAVMINLARPSAPIEQKKREKAESIGIMITFLLAPWIALLIGWLLK